jgi:hypothetical protein
MLGQERIEEYKRLLIQLALEQRHAGQTGIGGQGFPVLPL